ncbi:hypothetical protein DVA86_29545 [Streptomyces armeniacus]|uniref:DUF4232 domain-containing protein n=1 Tax=Streptomyces armeniacus TaxID=83291 RepID=A0A345XWV5_9ACTN|nr:hypothetical protein [Streptomyces armeniacus]AXK36121.1 hypothetical protein DVA86_29545 [Streptomyces armeniacus]
MGSLRNPIGPLPSSIYWRRRAVALSILALLVLLVVWALNMGGDSDDRSEAGGKGGPDGQGPTDSITPGPTTSKPPVSDRPGGRDEVDGGAGSGGGGGDEGADGGADGGGESGGTAGGGALSGSSGSVTGGGALPAGTGLSVCGSGSVTVTLSSVKNEYAPDDKPEFKLTVKNSGSDDCRINLGRTATVVTVSDSDDERIWSSADCPPSRATAYVQVPAKGSTVQTLTWDRKHSKPECAKAPAGSAKADTYLVEAEIKGLKAARTSFVLAKD